MFCNVIVSRDCIVGPNGYFGDAKITGSASVVIRCLRPKRKRDGRFSCTYEILYDGIVIHEESVPGIDSIEALLCAMRQAARCFDNQYFNKLGERRYRDVIPHIDAIPREWWHDMRIAGSPPMWIAEEHVLFQRADGQRTKGRIAIGCPSAGAMPVYPPSCLGWLERIDGPDAWQWDEYKAGSAFQALQLALSSMAARLREFVLSGGSVLTPDGSRHVDLRAMFGTMAP